MSRLLRALAWLVLLAALALWGLTALGVLEKDLFTALWDDAKRIGRQAEERVNQFIDESGIQEGAEKAAEKASEWLEGAANAAEEALPRTTPEEI